MYREEFTTPADRYFNYCWWPYTPVAKVEHKFRPVNLLFQSFELAAIDSRAFEVVEALRSDLGDFRTVYGVKWMGNRLGWEFYFYDYKRRERELSISKVLDTIRRFSSCSLEVNERLPYFMFSIDLDEDLVCGDRNLDVIHMYIGNPGSTVSSGISYDLREAGTTLENLYYFFNAGSQLLDIEEKVCCSAHVDATKIPISEILRPELRRCNTICIANKQHNDTAYFSGVDVGQLIFFLKWLNYPQPIIDFTEHNRAKLDHLLYDVGFDYTAKGNQLDVIKSGYYGVF
ncbi:MAG: hypothetical protein H6822_18205 [Planctomycetaceae bacterium]|nr:hypothetical protein [Planctomycetales bacterium]MCB9924119.1 hypothetical protein [Planctomycetaceae bacterium]